MKKLFYHIAVMSMLVIVSGALFAQAPDSTTTDRYLLDFVVPDIPAFKALGTDPSNILRPADAKKFAVSLSPFYSNGQAVIPKNFAVEFSPWKLASSDWTLKEYSENGWKRFFYNCSFSIGAVEDSTDFPNKLSIGYRVSFLSKRADILRLSWASLNTNMANIMAARQDIINHWVNNVVGPPIAERPTYYATHKKEFNEYLGNLKKQLKKTPDSRLQALYDALIFSLPKEMKTNSGNDKIVDMFNFLDSFGASIDKYIAKYKDENWNSSRLDVALAWVGESDEEALSSAQFSSFSTWVTWAIRTGKNKQLLVGVNFVEPKEQNEMTDRKFSGNLRYYIGTQAFRGFLETQYMFHNNQPVEKSVLVNFGAELKVGNKFWVSASGGVNNFLEEDNGFSKIVSSIDLKYGINKDK